MLNLENYQLGGTKDLLQLDTRKENFECTLAMADQCMRTLDIISRDLDPAIYNQKKFIEAVKRLALSSRHAKIRIIVFEPETIVRKGHQLIDLAQNLTSFIEIRKGATEDKDYNESLLIADTTGYIHRKNAERYEVRLNFNDKQQSKIFKNEFEEMWQAAKPDPNLRRISL